MFLTTQIQHFIKILLTYGLLIHSVGDFGFWQPRVNKLIRYLLPFAFLLLIRLYQHVCTVWVIFPFSSATGIVSSCVKMHVCNLQVCQQRSCAVVSQQWQLILRQFCSMDPTSSQLHMCSSIFPFLSNWNPKFSDRMTVKRFAFLLFLIVTNNIHRFLWHHCNTVDQRHSTYQHETTMKQKDLQAFAE